MPASRPRLRRSSRTRYLSPVKGHDSLVERFGLPQNLTIREEYVTEGDGSGCMKASGTDYDAVIMARYAESGT